MIAPAVFVVVMVVAAAAVMPAAAHQGDNAPDDQAPEKDHKYPAETEHEIVVIAHHMIVSGLGGALYTLALRAHPS